MCGPMGCAAAAMITGWPPSLGCPTANISGFMVTTLGGGWKRPRKSGGAARSAAGFCPSPPGKAGCSAPPPARMRTQKGDGQRSTENEKEAAGLTNRDRRVILNANSGWFRCPRCNRKLLQVLPDTSGNNIPIYCYDCKLYWIVSISSAQGGRT